MLQFLSNAGNSFVGYFNGLFAPSHVGLTVAVIALCFTSVNALVGISNFVLSRFRLIKVRQIRAYGSISADDPKGAEYFEVDVLSYGAAVWDLSVEVKIKVPFSKKFLKPGFLRTLRLELEPTDAKINPLNSGQAMRFRAKTSRDAGKGPGYDAGKSGFGLYFDGIAAEIPRRNIRLCVYSGRERETRKLLKHICSHDFHWKLDDYMQRVFNVRPSWWGSIRSKIEIWWIRRQSNKFERWVKEAGPQASAGAGPPSGSGKDK